VFHKLQNLDSVKSFFKQPKTSHKLYIFMYYEFHKQDFFTCKKHVTPTKFPKLTTLYLMIEVDKFHLNIFSGQNQP